MEAIELFPARLLLLHMVLFLELSLALFLSLCMRLFPARLLLLHMVLFLVHVPVP
jgi:hypothetical protein